MRNKKKIIAIIPARMGSSRFPGKPMAQVCGTPMIGHVWHRVNMCDCISHTYVATCDQEIFDYIKAIGGNAVMTKDSHQRCTERTSEALDLVEKEIGTTVDIVIMVQGDEPLVHPTMLQESIAPMLDDESVHVTNLVAPIEDIEDFLDPNEVKVVMDKSMNALYFSREPIPSQKKWQGKVPMNKQVCIIPFRSNYLRAFNQMEPTELEMIESIDMMRILENGGKIRMVPTKFKTHSVDTPEDLKWVETIMNNDPLFGKYRQ